MMEMQKYSTADEKGTASLITKYEEEKRDVVLSIDPNEDTRNQRQLTFRRLLSRARPEWRLLTGATICLILGALFTLAVPAFVGQIIDAITTPNLDIDEAFAMLRGSTLSLFFVCIVGSLFSAARGFMFSMAGERVVATLRQDLFHKIMMQEMAFFDDNRTGDLVNRLSSDTTTLKSAVTADLSMALRQVATIIGGIIYLFVISWQLTLVMLSVVPFVAIGARFYGKYIKDLSKKTQSALAEATTVAEESFSNMRTVKSFSREEWQNSQYDEKIKETYRLGVKVAIAYGGFIGFIGFLGLNAMILVLWYGATLVLYGKMSSGVLTSFVLYTITVGAALAGLSGLFSTFMKAVGANQRVFEILERKSLIDSNEGVSADSFQGKVVVRDVMFSYPARPDALVIDGLSLTLEPGTVTALVGPSGQGKSTVVSLLERFYDPTAGEILFDDVPLRHYNLRSLHSHVALVSQEPALFAASIKDNILYGTAKEVSIDKVREVAQLANAHDFIVDFPDGYDTMVGERGVQLSGGQKQRVAIARALLLSPQMLLLDEATSALDAESEHLVQEALNVLMNGRTVLVVAHRLSTVKNAHKVCVIEKGKVVEQGTHNELLKQADGKYAALVARQLSAAAEDLNS